MVISRIVRHSLPSRFFLWRVFSKEETSSLSEVIKEAEAGHSGQIRAVVEVSRPFLAILRREGPRERANEVFALERVWDTEENIGVLIYLCVADRAIEIVADRGIAANTTQRDWDSLCEEFRHSIQHVGLPSALKGVIKGVGVLIRKHFPVPPAPEDLRRNELSDDVIIL